ncbi:MAG: DUF6167 family protein [Actinomycetota bacterium]
MKRLFWIALGATAGVLVARQLAKAARNATPGGAADRIAGGLTGLNEAVREFTAEVRAGMAERETELRDALGISENGGGTVDLDRLHDVLEPDHTRGT